MAISDLDLVLVDELFEFSAPRFFDFINGETENDMRKAELWFDSNLSHAPSPCVIGIKTEKRSVQRMEIVCNFDGAVEPPQKINGFTSNDGRPLQPVPFIEPPTELVNDVPASPVPIPINAETKKMEAKPEVLEVVVTSDKKEDVRCPTQENERILNKVTNNLSAKKIIINPSTPQENERILNNLTNNLLAKKITKNPSAIRSQSHKKCPKPSPAITSASARREVSLKKTIEATKLTLDNQAIKKQKLEGGKSRQLWNIKPTNLQHKTRLGTFSNTCSSSSATSSRKEDRKIYVREVSPFVSTAEMMRKFQSGTRAMSLTTTIDHNGSSSSIAHRSNSKLTLTRPREPELVTSQRFRSAKIKSSSEIEEEMMATIPKFKARPLNKKILEASTLPPHPRSTPHPTQFNEFHLKTMARAATTIEPSSSSLQVDQSKPRLITTSKPPLLHTSLRARPVSVKSFEEIEKEELEKAPKFKARPINKKIFESKGDIGMKFSNTKKHVTVPEEFHFRIDERIPPPLPPTDLFEKMSLSCSETDKQGIVLPRNTRQNPFHLLTEERGAEKEKKFVMEVMVKEQEDERARLKKALPYPYSTDFPLAPHKPEARQCTKPEPFQLMSLVRHNEEKEKEMEERVRMEKEEAEMRLFKAQPIMRDDPIPVREKARIPLTEVQGFNLQVENRAVDRSEFERKIKEKEQMYKRYRDEEESARMMEEEKALKQLRKTLKPHARPVPNFSHPFLPQKSKKETTKAKSPKLQIDGRKEIRKVAVSTTAISCAASNMR